MRTVQRPRTAIIRSPTSARWLLTSATMYFCNFDRSNARSILEMESNSESTVPGHVREANNFQDVAYGVEQRRKPGRRLPIRSRLTMGGCLVHPISLISHCYRDDAAARRESASAVITANIAKCLENLCPSNAGKIQYFFPISQSRLLENEGITTRPNPVSDMAIRGFIASDSLISSSAIPARHS